MVMYAAMHTQGTLQVGIEANILVTDDKKWTWEILLKKYGCNKCSIEVTKQFLNSNYGKLLSTLYKKVFL